MKIDNRKNTYRIWLQKFVATVLFTPLIMVFSFSNFFDQPYMGIERVWYILILCLLYFLVFVWHWTIKPYFVSFSDTGDKIVMRYYPVRAFNRKKNSIEIPKKDFVRFEIEKYFPGMERLILYQRFSKGVGKYPAVNLSAVNRKDREKIMQSLLMASRR